LPESFSSGADLKAAYRLLGTEAVSYEAVMRGHCEQVRAGCGKPGEYLLVEDRTQLDYSWHPGAEQMGFIGNGKGRGFMLHSTLALRIERWNEQQEPEVTVVGLLGQRCWSRRHGFRKKKEKKADRLKRRRESQHWAAVLENTGAPPPEAAWTYVADRESDIYEVFVKCRQRQTDYIVRATRPRALAEEDRCVFDAVAASPVLGRFSLKLRARPGRSARTAVIEVRSCSVVLRAPWRPGGKGEPVPVNVVEAREVDAPEGVEPIRWTLLTSWACESFEQAMRVVKAYTRRWLIEEYHKALKTGTKVQDSQLSTPARIQALLGILAVVATRLLNMKLLASTRPDDPVGEDHLGPEALAILEAHYGRPAGGWTHCSVLVSMARLGGFLARKADGNPGWQTIWRGFKKLMLMSLGFAIANGERCG